MQGGGGRGGGEIVKIILMHEPQPGGGNKQGIVTLKWNMTFSILQTLIQTEPKKIMEEIV